jgi:hypothetical protein
MFTMPNPQSQAEFQVSSHNRTVKLTRDTYLLPHNEIELYRRLRHTAGAVRLVFNGVNRTQEFVYPDGTVEPLPHQYEMIWRRLYVKSYYETRHSGGYRKEIVYQYYAPVREVQVVVDIEDDGDDFAPVPHAQPAS